MAPKCKGWRKTPSFGGRLFRKNTCYAFSVPKIVCISLPGGFHPSGTSMSQTRGACTKGAACLTIWCLPIWTLFGKGMTRARFRKKNNKLNSLWPKTACLGPSFWPKNPPENVYVGPSFAFFPRNEAHELFPGAPKWGAPKPLVLQRFLKAAPKHRGDSSAPKLRGLGLQGGSTNQKLLAVFRWFLQQILACCLQFLHQ